MQENEQNMSLRKRPEREEPSQSLLPPPVSTARELSPRETPNAFREWARFQRILPEEDRGSISQSTMERFSLESNYRRQDEIDKPNSPFLAILRSPQYSRFSDSLLFGNGQKKTFFFSAAAEVTSLAGLGGAELAEGVEPFSYFNGFSRRSNEIAGRLGRRLYEDVNFPAYALLYQGRDDDPRWIDHKYDRTKRLLQLDGQALDYALVSIEQSFIQTFLENELSEKDRTRFIRESQDALNLTIDPDLRRVLKHYGDDFDFGNQAHREALGRALVDRKRQDFIEKYSDSVGLYRYE